MRTSCIFERIKRWKRSISNEYLLRLKSDLTPLKRHHFQRDSVSVITKGGQVKDMPGVRRFDGVRGSVVGCDVWAVCEGMRELCRRVPEVRRHALLQEVCRGLSEVRCDL